MVVEVRLCDLLEKPLSLIHVAKHCLVVVVLLSESLLDIILDNLLQSRQGCNHLPIKILTFGSFGDDLLDLPNFIIFHGFE